jgi:hypothetical protein
VSVRLDGLLLVSLLAASGCAYDWSDAATTGAGGAGPATTAGSGAGGSVTQTTSTGSGGAVCDASDSFATKNQAVECADGEVCLQLGGCDSPGSCGPDVTPTPSGIVCTACANQAYPSTAAANADGLAVVAGTDCLPAAGDMTMKCGAETCDAGKGETQCRHDVLASGIDTFTCATPTTCPAVGDPCCNADGCAPSPISYMDGTPTVFCLVTCPEQ